MQGFCAASNVVGYRQVVIPAQEYTMIGVMFEDVNGGAISVQDFIPDPLGQGLTGATGAANADQLMYWDTDEAGSYVTLYLCSNTATTSAAQLRHNKWLCKARQADTSWGAKANDPSTKTLISGMGFWLKRKYYAQPLTITMSGAAVVAESGRNVTIKEGYNMICGGYTSDFTPNPDVAGVGEAIDWIGKGCAGATGAANADQLMFWDPTEAGSYVTLYLCSNTATTSAAQLRHNKWLCKARQNDTSWGAKANDPTPKSIPAGRGIWYKRLTGKGSFTLNLDAPYSL